MHTPQFLHINNRSFKIRDSINGDLEESRVLLVFASSFTYSRIVSGLYTYVASELDSKLQVHLTQFSQCTRIHVPSCGRCQLHSIAYSRI